MGDRYVVEINYKSGWRNDQRILYSNDGLVFVSYDHYQTFSRIAVSVLADCSIHFLDFS